MGGESLSSYAMHRWFWALFWFFVLHNIEEAVGMWLMPDLRMQVTENVGKQWAALMPSPETFFVALLIVTAIMFVYVLVGTIGGPNKFQLYLLTIFAWLLLINVFLPHLPAAIQMKSYVPGLATAVLINGPLSIVVIKKLWMDEGFSFSGIMAGLVIAVVVLIGLLPLIHVLSASLAGYLNIAV